MDNRIKLVKIREEEVTANPKHYNSSFQQNEPEVQDLTDPIEEPQKFSRWLPLIAASQNWALSSVQIITLSRSQGRLIMTAANSSICTRQLNRVYAEELTEDLAPAFGDLRFPATGLFLRLDASSPKDGVGGPLRTVDDVVLKLTTSGRARSAISRLVEDEKPISLYFMAFDPAMDTALEYRVFCAPPTGTITAVSQYSWYRALHWQTK